MMGAMDLVRDRLLRAVSALEASKIAYAVVGGHAVAAWVSSVDPTAVRGTVDVDILIRRSDLGPTRNALEASGFIYRHVAGMDVFLDGPNGVVRTGVHLVFANEKVHPDEPVANPDVADSEQAPLFRVLTLEALARVKLTAFRDKDRTHLRDLLEVGLIDATWVTRFPVALGGRLQTLIDTPNG
jgi:hypothetical protein